MLLGQALSSLAAKPKPTHIHPAPATRGCMPCILLYNPCKKHLAIVLKTRTEHVRHTWKKVLFQARTILWSFQSKNPSAGAEWSPSVTASLFQWQVSEKLSRCWTKLHARNLHQTRHNALSKEITHIKSINALYIYSHCDSKWCIVVLRYCTFPEFSKTHHKSSLNCAAKIIETGTWLGRLFASYSDAERLGPQSHWG